MNANVEDATMRRRLAPVHVAMLLSVLAGALGAQTLGLPVVYHPVMRGFGAAFDAGVDDSGAPTIALAGIAALGHITADSLRLPVVNVSGTVTEFGGDAHPGGRAFGIEVTLFTSFALGVNRSNWRGVKRLYFPLAAAIPLMACANRKKLIEVYAVPLWSFERVEQPGNTSWQPSWGSVGLGAIFEFRSGIGFQAELSELRRQVGADPYHRAALSVGIHWSPHSIVKEARSRAPSGKMECGLGL